jgi:hypothetical protein
MACHLDGSPSAWPEHEQEKINRFFQQWLKMLQDELGEKAQTVVEIMARLDMPDEKIANRVASNEYGFLRLTFSGRWI